MRIIITNLTNKGANKISFFSDVNLQNKCESLSGAVNILIIMYKIIPCKHLQSLSQPIVLMIIISSGMQKSSSGWIFNIINDLLIINGNSKIINIK